MTTEVEMPHLMDQTLILFPSVIAMKWNGFSTILPQINNHDVIMVQEEALSSE